MDAPLPEIRVGDQERRAVDERLRAALADGVLTLSEYDERAALCWAARVRSDLDVLVQDLPAPAQQAAPEAAAKAVAAGATARGGGGSRMPQRVVRGVAGVALIGAVLYSAIQVVGADDGAAVFGGGVVQVAADQTRVDVGVLFGSMQIVVPDGMRARSSGTVLFGELECVDACRPGGPGREVLVEGQGGFGSVEVLTQAEFARGEDRENDRDDD